MKIRTGSLAEVVQVVNCIDEFVEKESEASLAARLAGKKQLVLVAEQDGQLLGFKIGYQQDEQTFYSWLGGVAPLARNTGVAQLLLDHQQRWAAEQDYRWLTVKSRNRFPAMLRLLLRNGYQIHHFEPYQPLEESRIHFIKALDKIK
ncbi:N-acetyltransferase family protein [Vibrio sp.]|uniref:GNAT family N-acetyltransferase n=1 Tax=Vibrio sp. TaxID=678 RepID=UPI003D0A3F71